MMLSLGLVFLPSYTRCACSRNILDILSNIHFWLQYGLCVDGDPSNARTYRVLRGILLTDVFINWQSLWPCVDCMGTATRGVVFPLHYHPAITLRIIVQPVRRHEKNDRRPVMNVGSRACFLSHSWAMIAPDLIGRIPINWSERAGWQVGRMDHWWAVTLAQHLHCSVKFLAVFGQYQLAGR